MFKKTLLGLAAILFVMGAATAMAEVGTGDVFAKSGDVDINIFGSLKTYPHFMNNADFNDDNTPFDFLGDEHGDLDDDTVTVRNEARLGFSGEGRNWTFLTILEADFALTKNNADRSDTGGNFGIEKLEYTYNFSDYGAPLTIETGWQTKWTDIETGGLLYGDDHPYIGLRGVLNDISWEALTLFIQDDPGENAIDADQADWEAYILKGALPLGGLNMAPFYVFSHNTDREADVHYLGVQSYGKLGMLTPRAEFIYAVGNKDDYIIDGNEADISAWAGFAALEINISDMVNPYFGGQIVTGDSDATDDDIEAFNPITNISRYTPTFGMENAFIYRNVPVLGSQLYSNVPDTLGRASGGYGGIGNSAKAESPGMYSLGLGCKGKQGKFSYKTQLQYFWFEETGALEDLAATEDAIASDDIDDAIGLEFDLQITYHFNDHFSIGNVISIFDPGDGVEDLRGSDYDDTAYLDTIELTWTF